LWFKRYPELFDHLRRQHPAAAADLMRTLQARSLSLWGSYYVKPRREARLAVALYVDHASPLFREPLGIRQLYFGESFYLHLDSDIEGYVIGFWKFRDYWFSLLVGPTPVQKGRQWITRDDVRDDPVTKAVFGGSIGTGEIRPILYRGKERYPELVTIVADEPTVHQLTGAGGNYDLPIRERTLDTFPAILESSKNPWSISWVSPSCVPQEGWFKRSG
jgi:hypothetical protein